MLAPKTHTDRMPGSSIHRWRRRRRTALQFLKEIEPLRRLQERFDELHNWPFGERKQNKARCKQLQAQLDANGASLERVLVLLGDGPMVIVASYLLEPWLTRPLRFLPWIEAMSCIESTQAFEPVFNNRVIQLAQERERNERSVLERVGNGDRWIPLTRLNNILWSKRHYARATIEALDPDVARSSFDIIRMYVDGGLEHRFGTCTFPNPFYKGRIAPPDGQEWMTEAPGVITRYISWQRYKKPPPDNLDRKHTFVLQRMNLVDALPVSVFS